MKFLAKLFKRIAARRDKARSALKRSVALATTQSILAERKHWVEAGRAPRGQGARG
jgi:hypothetical protein